jgi:hypothetical protein
MKMVQYIVVTLVEERENENYSIAIYPARTIATTDGKLQELVGQAVEKLGEMHTAFVKKNVGWVMPSYVISAMKTVLENFVNAEVQRWIDNEEAASVEYDPIVGETIVSYREFSNAVDKMSKTSDGLFIHRQSAANMAASRYGSYTVH